MNFLLLPHNHTADDAIIWRAAIARGMRTIRAKDHRGYEAELPHGVKADQLFYYGNTLHATTLVEAMMIDVRKINPHWPVNVPHHTLGRKVDVVRYKAFRESNDPTEYFVKCVHEKWFKPGVYSALTLPDGASMPDDVLHVQPVKKFRDEVRCFVLDGAIVTWSYYRRNGKLWSQGVHADVPAQFEWQQLVDDLMDSDTGLSPNIVVDVGLMDHGNEESDRSFNSWFIIEVNEPWASGVYDCNPERCLDVIMANQRDRR